MNRTLRHLILSWAALLVLLGISAGAAYLPLGVGHEFLPVCIAVAQALIIALVFMNLRGRLTVRTIFAAAGFYMLLILLGLITTDYATRSGTFSPEATGQSNRPEESGR